MVDEIWSYESEWAGTLKSRGSVPQMRADHISTAKSEDSPVPDLKGMGLRDAIYAIENNGYRCSHTGTGHVTSQSPAAGTSLSKGKTISITLK
jgi:cell division protein FtsI (penicillin-binding protein 3)